MKRTRRGGAATRTGAWVVLLALGAAACGEPDTQGNREAAELRARVHALEKRVDELAPSVPVADGSAPATGPAPAGDGEANAHSRAEIDWFRGLEQKVNELERNERYAAWIARKVDAADLELTDEQRRGVIDAAIDYGNRLQDYLQLAEQRGDDLGTRQALVDGLRSEYEKAIHGLLPDAEASKVMRSIGSYAGYGEWR